jgi:DNA-binding NtrC family response regulator
LDSHARILVVDDDESIRKVLTTILEEEGYSVEMAESGREAIRKSNERFYNLALIDIRLPDMMGTHLLAAIKETIPKMVKIIITGYPSLQNAIEAVNSGADAYILKPFNVDKTLGLIREYLKEQQEDKKYSQTKVAEFIETRAREIEATNRKKHH